MWKSEQTITLQDADIQALWDAHADIANWPKWHPGLAYTQIDGSAQEGTVFYIKPSGSPKTRLKVTKYERPYVWTDLAFLPLAKMYTTTRMKEVSDGVEVHLEIEMKGPLTFLWKKIIGKELLEKHLSQNQAMLAYIRDKR